MEDESLEELVDKYRAASDVEIQIKFMDQIAAVMAERIETFVRNYLFRRDKVEDVVQTIWLKIVKGIDGFDGRGSFAGWCLRVAFNTCNDEIRRQYRELTNPVDPATLAEHPEEEATTVDYPGGLTASDLAEHLIRRLPERCQKLIRMYFFDDLIHREIGESLAESTGAIRVTFGRCLARARVLFLKERQTHA